MQLYQVLCCLSRACALAQKYKSVLLGCKKAEKPNTKGAAFWKIPRDHLTIGKSASPILMHSACSSNYAESSTGCYDLYLRGECQAPHVYLHPPHSSAPLVKSLYWGVHRQVLPNTDVTQGLHNNKVLHQKKASMIQPHHNLHSCLPCPLRITLQSTFQPFI